MVTVVSFFYIHHKGPRGHEGYFSMEQGALRVTHYKIYNKLGVCEGDISPPSAYKKSSVTTVDLCGENKISVPAVPTVVKNPSVRPVVKPA